MIATIVADVNVPAAGVNVGVAGFISYVTVPTALTGAPVFQPLTFRVWDCVMAIVAPDAIVGSDSVGSLPFCVYRIVLPAVAFETTTLKLLSYVPRRC